MKSPKTTKNTEILPDVSKLDAYARECWDENVFRISRNSMVGDTFRLYHYNPSAFQFMVDKFTEANALQDTFWGQLITAISSDDVEGELKKLNPDYKIIWNNVLKSVNERDGTQ